MAKICPHRMQIGGIETMGCIGQQCAWWDEQEQACCILVDVLIRRKILADSDEGRAKYKQGAEDARWRRVQAAILTEGFSVEAFEAALAHYANTTPEGRRRMNRANGGDPDAS